MTNGEANPSGTAVIDREEDDIIIKKSFIF